MGLNLIYPEARTELGVLPKEDTCYLTWMKPLKNLLIKVGLLFQALRILEDLQSQPIQHHQPKSPILFQGPKSPTQNLQFSKNQPVLDT
jgi:hypothetical protein